MNTKLIFLSALIVSLAMGFVLYSNPGYVEELNVASGAQYEETAAASSDQYGVPADILYTRPVETVAFSHKTHAVELEYKCSTCHSGLFQMQAKSVQSKPDFNMKGLADGKYCGSCHSGEHEAAFASDTQCARCHIGVTGLEKETGLEGESLEAQLQAENGEEGEPAGNG
ncbi:MAG: cytochrome c3 family protein [Thermoleophilia bacterium]|nr:cytochrome c3 family protein [Thermoleophilia bacterium]